MNVTEFNTPVRFDGDIIITDPCYLMRQNSRPDYTKAPHWWDFVSKVTYEEITDSNGKTFKRYNIPEATDYPDCRDKTMQDYIDEVSRNNENYYEGELTLSDIKKRAEMNFRIALLKDDKPQFSPTLNAEWEAYYKAEEEWKENNVSDWQRCEYGDNMGVLGFTTSLVTSTLYGDWGCTTYKLDSLGRKNKKIGSFCADAGLVGVFYLNEILKYNPDYNDHLDKDGWCATWIKDFHGEVMVQTLPINKYRQYPDRVPNGWDDEARVVGTGNINFIGCQTSKGVIINGILVW